MGFGQVWEVVGGVGKGGIIVRRGNELSSPQEPFRLATGALVTEEELHGERIRFRRLSGEGPDSGWALTNLAGKRLLVPRDDRGASSVPAATNSSAPASKSDEALSAAKERALEVHRRVLDGQQALAREKEKKKVKDQQMAEVGFEAAPPEVTTELDDDEWRTKLSVHEFYILREGGTDPPASHPYTHFFPSEGYFACRGCGLPLYTCDSKFLDHGWPAWDKCFYSKDLGFHVGACSGGAIEIHCARCKGHLGHLFPEGARDRH
eukprot:gnl/TRDRNA2_/TRDRNA2_87841_c0_seq1.p1 gnl/TRDRNA2_/TRDRNA2_87841_c0~~gnl/TRDRNA2_/TRDRNA2_87841_c0_seq1.p1  ORF type:complete len:264 (-),score=35.55 gnl/TRDRNA2_/TRDRNA2_87841_c0_seq1:456-1247(-)